MPSFGSRTLIRPPLVADRFPAATPTPAFYQCGICCAMHWSRWDGDCREDQARFDIEQLDDHYGCDGWAEVSMPGGEE
jgi:hypothetical protein